MIYLYCEGRTTRLNFQLILIVVLSKYSFIKRRSYVKHRKLLNLLDIKSRLRHSAKSFVDDLVLGRGVVPSRAVSLLRSTETYPSDGEVCVQTKSSFKLEALFHYHNIVMIMKKSSLIATPANAGFFFR